MAAQEGVGAGAPGEVRPALVGCSGWNYASWRGPFYPAGLPPRRWLARYAKLFTTVEVNATFYRLPTRAAVANWVEQTPPEFVFTVKVSRYVTHMKRLTTVADGWRRLCERIEPMIEAGRLGPLLWQLPERFRRDDERLAGALAELPPGRHCFEFRHASWFSDDVYALLAGHGVALVVGDHPGRPFQQHRFTAPFTVVRFHYGSRGRAGNYSRAELERWAARLDAWRRRVDVYAYFNNDWNAFAPRNARLLERLLERRAALA
jgi:uncharacterized protein YecE (DUF72 family)